MNRTPHKWMAALVLLLFTFAGIVAAQSSLQQGRGQAVTPSELQAMKQMFDANQRHEAAMRAIEQNRDAFVQDIVSRWTAAAAERGAAERGLVMLRTGLFQAGTEKLIRASEATSYDNLLAVLYGSPVGSVSAPPMLLSSPLSSDKTTPGPNTLGNNSLDLVYTPIQPCRALDSRLATGSYGGVGFAGPYTPNSTHSFAVTDPINFYGSQGGLDNCGIPVTAAKAVALNITVAGMAGYGFLKVYPWGTAAPNASIINYAPGGALANAVVQPICLNCDQDLNIGTFSASTDVIIDVLGYFAAPLATAVGTTTVATGPSTISAQGAFTVDSPACPSGYTLASGGFNETNTTTGLWIYQNAASGTVWRVRGNNQSGTSVVITVYGICAQVPGR